MKDIAKILKSSEKIAIFVHVSADGDALGSAFALKYCLEKQGKIVDVYLNEPVSERLEFLSEKMSFKYKIGKIDGEYNVFVALDCGDEFRLGAYKDSFLSHHLTVNIDHHFTNNGYAMYNYVDAKAAACGEIIALLAREMEFELDENLAMFLYTAISSDTGCFAYSNVTEHTHLLAAKLTKTGIDCAQINRNLFSTLTVSEIKLKAFVMQSLELYHGGNLAVAVVTEDKLKECGASYEHTEGLVDILRSIKGVEIGCLIKEKDNQVKGSIRTNTFVDASEISSELGGGGHKRAAGFSTSLSIEDTKKMIIDITKNFFRGSELDRYC